MAPAVTGSNSMMAAYSTLICLNLTPDRPVKWNAIDPSKLEGAMSLSPHVGMTSQVLLTCSMHVVLSKVLAGLKHVLA